MPGRRFAPAAARPTPGCGRCATPRRDQVSMACTVLDRLSVTGMNTAETEPAGIGLQVLADLDVMMKRIIDGTPVDPETSRRIEEVPTGSRRKSAAAEAS